MKNKHEMKSRAIAILFSLVGVSAICVASAQASVVEVPLTSNYSLNNLFYNGESLGAEIASHDSAGQLAVGANSFLVSNYDGTSGTIASWLDTNETATIGVSQTGVTSVLIEMGSAYGKAGDTVGTLTFTDAAGTNFVDTLVEGTNVRDSANNTTTTDGPTPPTQLYALDTFGNQSVDVYNVVLPTSFASSTLTSIAFHDDYALGNTNGEPFLSAVDLNVAATGGVPEAPTYLMALIGMAAIGGFSLRKRTVA